MSDKRKQTSLTFDVSGALNTQKVKQAWQLTFAKQKKVSKYTKRIMSFVISQVRENSKPNEVYRVHVSQIIENNEVIPYRVVQNTFKELTSMVWLIEAVDNVDDDDWKKKTFAYRHLINTTVGTCNYSDGYFNIVLNPYLMPYFIEIARYSTYDLKHYMVLKSFYSMRLWELLSAYKRSGFWKCTLAELNHYLDTSDKYLREDGSQHTAKLILATIKKAMDELKGSKMEFTYEVIRDKNPSKRGQDGVLGFIFQLKHKAPQLKEVPSEWLDNPKDKLAIEGLRKWQVSEVNIANYYQDIGRERVYELCREWENRKGTDKHIISPLKYCNKAIHDEGTAIIENNLNNLKK